MPVELITNNVIICNVVSNSTKTSTSYHGNPIVIPLGTKRYKTKSYICICGSCFDTVTKQYVKDTVHKYEVSMNTKTCFVIMPFSQTTEKHTEKYWNDFFEVICNEMQHKGYLCERSETGPYHMMRSIIERINSSDLVIAVLTDLNPNVWYELGIRHSLKNGTLMLIEETQRIPFDISAFGLVKYPDGIALAIKLKTAINNYLKKLENAQGYDSPVLDILGLPASQKNKLDEMYELVLKIANEKSELQDTKIRASKTLHNRVLWVDDYPSNNSQIIELFERHSVRFDIALNTASGLESLKDNDYDLIITDMGRGAKPDAGIELIQEVAKIDKAIPIIVFASVQAIQRYGQLAQELGAVAVTNGAGNIISLISRILNITSALF